MGEFEFRGHIYSLTPDVVKALTPGQAASHAEAAGKALNRVFSWYQRPATSSTGAGAAAETVFLGPRAASVAQVQIVHQPCNDPAFRWKASLLADGHKDAVAEVWAPGIVDLCDRFLARVRELQSVLLAEVPPPAPAQPLEAPGA